MPSEDDIEYGLEMARNAAITSGLIFGGVVGLVGLLFRRLRWH